MIYRLFEKNAAFDPDAVKILTIAYEDVLRVLRLADRSDPITELIAKKIIELRYAGERDPERLRERTLQELGVGPITAP
jgi:hypothetical protein